MILRSDGRGRLRDEGGGGLAAGLAGGGGVDFGLSGTGVPVRRAKFFLLGAGTGLTAAGAGAGAGSGDAEPDDSLA